MSLEWSFLNRDELLIHNEEERSIPLNRAGHSSFLSDSYCTSTPFGFFGGFGALGGIWYAPISHAALAGRATMDVDDWQLTECVEVTYPQR